MLGWSFERFEDPTKFGRVAAIGKFIGSLVKHMRRIVVFCPVPTLVRALSLNHFIHATTLTCLLSCNGSGRGGIYTGTSIGGASSASYGGALTTSSRAVNSGGASSASSVGVASSTDGTVSGGTIGSASTGTTAIGNPELSIEVGRTLWGNDHAVRNDAPAGGTLFSVWTKIPDPGSTYPWSRGNMDVYVLFGKNWHLRCLIGNSSATSAIDARYNANSMLFANPGQTWVGDFSYFESGDGNPEAPYRDWVWAAWQVVVNTNSFTIRQWLKFGIDGAVIAAGESMPTFSDVRSILLTNGWTQASANAWVPGDAASFQVGSDNGYLYHARMASKSGAPHWPK